MDASNLVAEGQESGPRRPSADEVATALERHRAWVASGGLAGEPADFREADLRGADFKGANLQGARFQGANLAGADLRGANLRKLDLAGLKLEKSDLTGANLYRASLRGADLSEARLRRADLTRADLREADLGGASLVGADLGRANLQLALLRKANFRDANLQDADLTGTQGLLVVQLGGANLAGAKVPDDVAKFEGLGNVAEASKNTQNLFTSILLVCSYTWLTIASTSDGQLLNNNAPPASRLPILGTDIPLVRFYAAAPLLLLCLYIYFHLGLQRLWEELADLPAVFPDGRPLDKKAYPWLMNVLIRAHAARLKDNRSHLSRWQSRISVLLGWGLVPATLLPLWCRYLRAHDWMVTAGHVLIVASTIGAGAGFLRLAASTLRGSERRAFLWQRAWRDARAGGFGVALGATMLLGLISFGAIEGINPDLVDAPPTGKPTVQIEPIRGVRQLDPRHWVPRGFAKVGYSPFAHVEDVSLSVKPANWVSHKSQPSAKDKALPPHLQKAEELAGVKGADLERRNLRFAKGYNVFLVNAYGRWADVSAADLRDADLRNADFRDADLSRTNLRDADLHGADLKRANLYQTRFFNTFLGAATLTKAVLIEADLTNAILQGADLVDADLRRAKLNGAMLDTLRPQEGSGDEAKPATLAGANLQGADLSGANLSRAILKGANLSFCRLDGANLAGADLSGADLSGAIGLTEEGLAAAVTDADTKLPDGLRRQAVAGVHALRR